MAESKPLPKFIVKDTNETKEKLVAAFKKYSDWPIEGVVFFDFFSIMANVEIRELLYQACIDLLDKSFEGKPKFDGIVGLESRGFIIGTFLSQHYRVPFIPIRKKGKLIAREQLYEASFVKEYGKDECEIQANHLEGLDNLLLVDDFLATGGTMRAAEILVGKTGKNIAGMFVVLELLDLAGVEKLEQKEKVISLIGFNEEHQKPPP